MSVRATVPAGGGPALLGAIALAVLAGLAPAPSPAGAGAPPCSQQPSYDPAITPPGAAIAGWPARRASSAELADYFALVDSQSDRVSSEQFATSHRGRPLVYALASDPDAVATADQVAATQRRLRDPRVTTPAEAGQIAAQSRAIAWYVANVHGDEPSGGDAALSLLYELAAREDCVAERIRDRLLVGLMPSQNPDGRDAANRVNAYRFDMNRDWFARTQPETDGKLDVLSRFPPVLLVDAHEMTGSRYFFPPNADPIHHEIAAQPLSWINEIYGPGLAREFDRRHRRDPTQWGYFNYSIYDLFYMGYADTVGTTAYTAAGMTYEKGGRDPFRRRWREQRVAGWTSLELAAERKRRILAEYYRAHAQALRQGTRGRLEPNQVIQPENAVETEVPAETVRNYFIPGEAAYPQVGELVRRLLAMEVEVYRLTAALEVPELRHYGEPPVTETLPAGTYWVPMAQPQKHWIQALLGEDSYVPFPYFYDVTAWSNPLLMNLDASFAGALLEPAAEPVTAAPEGGVDDPGASTYFRFPGDTGRSVAAALALVRGGGEVVRIGETSPPPTESGEFVVTGASPAALAEVAARFRIRLRGESGAPPAGEPVADRKVAVFLERGESVGHLSFLLRETWGIPIDHLTGPQIAAGALADQGFDVLIVPGVKTDDLARGGDQIRSWVRGGGVYVGSARPGGVGGTPYAIGHGLTSARAMRSTSLEAPGTMFRVQLEDQSPLTLGARRSAYWFNLGEDILQRTETGVNVAAYPGSRAGFFVSGFARGLRELRGSAGLVEEKLGGGRVVLFSGEPNFRAFTDGVSFLLANAIVYPDRAPTAASDLTDPRVETSVAAARASALPVTGPGRPISLAVPIAEVEAARQVVLSVGARKVSVATGEQTAVLSIPNPRGLEPDDHPFARELVPALLETGIEVRWAEL